MATGWFLLCAREDERDWNRGPTPTTPIQHVGHWSLTLRLEPWVRLQFSAKLLCLQQLPQCIITRTEAASASRRPFHCTLLYYYHIFLVITPAASHWQILNLQPSCIGGGNMWGQSWPWLTVKYISNKLFVTNAFHCRSSDDCTCTVLFTF